MIFDVLGAPSPADVAHIKNVQAVKFLEQQQRKRKVKPGPVVWVGLDHQPLRVV